LGKRAVGIKVTDLHGERIDFGRALGRMFGHILSFITFSIGFAMAVFTERRQTLHDKLAGTLVVKREESPEDVEAAGIAPPAPMWQSISAVLGLVLFGPFGVGILAAIAIPAYQNYTLRAQVTEGLNIAAPYKTAIANAIAEGTPLNRVDSSRLDVSMPDSAKYVESVRVVQGAIDIQYGRAANKKIKGGHLILMPGVKGTEVYWFCGHASAPPDVTVPVQGYEKYTSVPDNVLPRACTPGGSQPR
jgi:Tfp pilus assembly major pilin PilA